MTAVRLLGHLPLSSLPAVPCPLTTLSPDPPSQTSTTCCPPPRVQLTTTCELDTICRPPGAATGVCKPLDLYIKQCDSYFHVCEKGPVPPLSWPLDTHQRSKKCKKGVISSKVRMSVKIEKRGKKGIASLQERVGWQLKFSNYTVTLS